MDDAVISALCICDIFVNSQVAVGMWACSGPHFYSIVHCVLCRVP